MELLNIEVTDGTSPPVLAVKGEIDIATVDALRAALVEAIAVGSTVVIDMAGVQFIDGAGLRVVLEAAESLNGGGPLTILNPPPLVERVLTVVGFGELPSIELRYDGEVRRG